MKTFTLFNKLSTLKNLFLVFFILAATEIKAQTIQLTSPDKNVCYNFRRAKQSPVYSVLFKGTTLVEDAPLWLNFNEGGKFAKDLSFGERSFKLVNDHHGYSEVTIPIKERDGLKRHVNLVIRAYNDGIAFRYDYSGGEAWKSFTIGNENHGFELVQEPGLLDRLNAGIANSATPVKPVSLGSNSTVDSNIASAQTAWRFMKIDENIDVAAVKANAQNAYTKNK
jgi:hypothetical protein